MYTSVCDFFYSVLFVGEPELADSEPAQLDFVTVALEP